MKGKNALLTILFVIDGVEYGGGERVFFQLADGLKDRYRIFVATKTGNFFEQKLTQSGIKVMPVDMHKRISWDPVRKLHEIIRAHEIDILHSQGVRADFFSRLAGRKAGVPCIVCTVAMPVEGFDTGFIKKKVYRFFDWLFERYVDRFIVVSESLKHFLVEKRSIQAKRVVKIYNGIELEHFHPGNKMDNLREEFRIPQDAPLLGAIGRMVWQKGFEYLITAIPDIVRAIPEARVLLVGDGPLKGALKEKSEKLKVADRCIFAGFRSDIKDILTIIDILVVPSLLEGFPMITLEAMAMAKPVIATAIEGITEQISTEKDGLLIPPKDNRALASAVIGLINNKERATVLGLAAREKVEKLFSVSKMINETDQIYQEIMGEQKA